MLGSDLGTIQAPERSNPTVLQDVTNRINFTNALRKRKALGAPIAEDSIAESVIEEHSIIQALGGVAVAPPWFTQAIAQALAPIEATQAQILATQAQMQATQAQMQEDLSVLAANTARALNRSSFRAGDPLVPLNNNAEVVVVFPRTIDALACLTVAHANIIIAGYGLEVQPRTLEAKKAAIRKHIGLLSSSPL